MTEFVCKLIKKNLLLNGKNMRELPYANVFKDVSHFKTRLDDSYDHTRSCESLNMSYKIPYYYFEFFNELGILNMKIHK